MNFNRIFTALILGTAIGCAKKLVDETTVSSGSSSSYLYVVSGLCYSGQGFTTFNATTSSNIIYRVDPATGAKADGGAPIVDYYSVNSGDTPVGIVDWDTSNIMVLIENSTGGRRVEKVQKKVNADRSLFLTNTTILSTVLRGMRKGADGSLFILKSNLTAGTGQIEKVSSTAVRQTVGANPWITAPGGTCGTSTTYMSSLSVLSNNKLIFTHAANTLNRIGVIGSNGYATAADCLAAQTPGSATAFPTASVYIPSTQQLIVSFGNSANAANNNSIRVYNVDESTGALTLLATPLDYSTGASYLYGISAMTFDSSTNSLYVATANGTSATVQNYNIEKFTFDSATGSLTRVGTSPFIVSSNDTKCISDLMISN